jgi:hypothetical protein
MQQVGRLALRAPVFGWMIHDAIHGLPDAKYYFAVNVAIVWALLVYLIGFPFLIVSADLLAFSALGFIIYMSAADSFSAAGRKYARAMKMRARAPI